MDELAQKRLDKKLAEVRAERYALQSVSKKAMPNERVSKCLRMATNGRAEIWKHLNTQKAFFNGLVTCGSVWLCPVCAAKISERRRLELKQAFDIHKAEGGKIGFLTLTFSHKRKDKLKTILSQFTKATSSFMSGKKYNEIREEMGLIGRVKALEVKYSDSNGFHPHAHYILFYNNDIDFEDMEERMYELYKKACRKNRLTIDRKHGLRLQSGEEAEKYMSKWSLEQEMTKAHIKVGKGEEKKKSLTPFDFLRVYLKEEDERYLQLFKEYATYFKGKRQLSWSQGLKNHFIIEEKTDEALSKEKMEDADLLGFIEFNEWKMILKYEKRAQVLEYCEKYGFKNGMKLLLDDLNSFDEIVYKKEKGLIRFPRQISL